MHHAFHKARHKARMFAAFYQPHHFAYARSDGSSDVCSEDQSRHHYETRRHHRGGFGVRRPLRYLSHHLDLDESQLRVVAASLDRLKMERQQSELDQQKTVSSLADIVTQEDLAVDDVRQALQLRQRSTEQLQLATAKAVQEIVAVLDPDQRRELAYLLRSGAVSF